MFPSTQLDINPEAVVIAFMGDLYIEMRVIAGRTTRLGNTAATLLVKVLLEL